jgi:SAM-dependent methyltransferase
MPVNVLFVSHRLSQCGVHEFGKNVGSAINKSTRHNFIYVECESLAELNTAISSHAPAIIIYNYTRPTLPWLTKKIIHTKHRSLINYIKVPQIGIIHEVTQERADNEGTGLFDYHIGPDPTLLLKNPVVFKTGRLVPEYHNLFPASENTVIGSFGFATANKGFPEIIHAVQKEFDSAIIRFNIPSADFGDKAGGAATLLVKACKKLITKPGISLEVTHDFLSKNQILDFLAQNTINVFLYHDEKGRGLSSTIDYALAVDRPLAVSDSTMFRHLRKLEPPVVLTRSSLKQVIKNGSKPLQALKKEWDEENLIWDYERIIDAVLKKEEEKKNQASPGRWKQFKTTVRQALGLQKRSFTWLRSTESLADDDTTVDTTQTYTPVNIPGNYSFNRILDNSARKLYAPAVKKLTELLPLTMAKKIAEANVQQGFIFDTVFRSTVNYSSPKILCVGSYEDTASMSLKRLGFVVEEIDPVMNYYLQEFYTKPTTKLASYDIIFSTSVIEHDPDDESFIRCISGLLAPGGIAVITCDYNDQWKPGDPKPEVDARFYTQKDLKNRLLPLMTDCFLLDEPDWDCPNPDFNFMGIYQYTFASFVIKKNQVNKA